MDRATAEWLTSPDAVLILAAGASEENPASLAAGERLRRLVAPHQAAAVAEQVTLRRQAVRKLGAMAEQLFFTRDGLEQATRPAVAARRAARWASMGVGDVVDLTCGLGLDALAFAHAGLRTTAVEIDPVTAVFARANLAGQAEVVTGDAVSLASELLASGSAAFCDPARRTTAGRSWRVEDLTPPWAFVSSLLDADACVKLGPGFPLTQIPDHVEAEWVSDRGDVVECALWGGQATTPGRRRAVVDSHELVSDHLLDAPAPGPVGRYVYEPDGAVLRSGLAASLAQTLDAHPLASGVGYLSGDVLVDTPFAEAFEVTESLPFSEKVLRGWVRDRRVGVLDIKKRGVDADPAVLRKRLKPSGSNAATLIVTPTLSRTMALVVTRVMPPTCPPRTSG